MKKKKLIIISVMLFAIVTGLVTFLYDTFAIDTSVNYDSYNVYKVALKDPADKTVILESGESKTIIYKIHNDNDGTVQYGIGYNSGTGIDVLLYNDSEDSASGTITKNEYKYVKLRLINHGNSKVSVTLKTILGYENGGKLILPAGFSLITSSYQAELLTNHIINLSQNNSTSIKPTLSSDTFSVSQLNGLYSYKTVPKIGFNIYRYYGTDPSNYIYFNCDNYNLADSGTCEIWRIIGVFDNKVKIVKYMDKGNEIDFYSDKRRWNDSTFSGSRILSWSESSLNSYLNNEYYNLFSDKTKKFISSNGIWGVGQNQNSQKTPFDRVTEDFNVTLFPEVSKIGILQSSDYVMAADIFNCPINNTIGDSYEECASTDWLYPNNHYLDFENEWLMNNSSNNVATSIGVTGGLAFTGHDIEYAYRPVLYLNPGVVISSGFGDIDDPYVIDL